MAKQNISTSSDVNAPKSGTTDVRDISHTIMSNYGDLSEKMLSKSYGDIDKLQKEVAEKQKQFLKFYYDNAKNASDISLKNLNQQKAAFANVNEELKKLIKLEEEKTRKALGTLTFGLSDFFLDIKKGWKEATKSGGDWRDKTMGIASMAGAFKPLVDYLIDVLFMNDKMQTDIAKNLGVSKGESVGILDAYRGIAANSGQTLTFAKDLIEANAQISSQYSMMVPITGNILTNQTFMTKELGLQADEASRLNSIFLLNGNQGREGLDIVYKQVAEYANQNKILFSGKAILSEISKISGQIRASFKGSTEEMAKSVIEATRLGTTLSQTRSMSESLLNFETSIDSELKAELLTGQQLNLEKARALALSGQYVESGKEMLEQAGGLGNFQKLNVIQQRALAEAVGLTGDQMADILFKQSETGKFAEDLADKYEAIGDFAMASRIRNGELDAQGLKAAEATLSSQQKFEASMERVKEIFSKLVNNNFMDKFATLMEQFVKVWASDGLASAMFHDYNKDFDKDQAEKDASKLKDLSGDSYNKEVSNVLKGRAKEADIRAESDVNSSFRQGVYDVLGAITPIMESEDYKRIAKDNARDEYYKQMIAALNKIATNPVPAQLSTSVLSQFLIDQKAHKGS